MSITPISPSISLPVLSESVNIDIAPTSKYGQAYDVARITTMILLATPLVTAQKFLLPKSADLWSPKMTTENGMELQYTLDGVDAGALEKLKLEYKTKSDEYIKDPSNDIRDVLKELTDELYQLSQYTTVKDVPVGTQLIKFSFTKPINKDEKGNFVIENLVPMASFTMQNGSKIHALIAMPFVSPISLDNIIGTWANSASNQVQPLHKANIDNRIILSAFWQQDPKLTITYHY